MSSTAFTPLTISNTGTGGRLTLTLIPYGATATHLVVAGTRVRTHTRTHTHTHTRAHTHTHAHTRAEEAGAAGGVDVLLGFDNSTWYCAYPQHPYFGATIGRYANRIANGTFALHGKMYETPLNELWPGGGGDTLHGGTIGYDRREWAVLQYDPTSHVTFQYTSPDGEMGFPGTVRATVTHALTSDDAWLIQYTADTDQDTVVSMTNHAYFSLHGFMGDTQDVLEHVLQADASTYMRVDANLIPTGAIGSVTPDFWLNFTVPKAIGRDIANGTVTPTGGYDNALLFDSWQPRQPPTRRAVLHSPLSGITMEFHTDQPSVQLYSGNFLNGSIPRKADQTFGPDQFYQRWSAVTLEAQAYVDAVQFPAFPSTVLRAGETYRQTTMYKFV